MADAWRPTQLQLQPFDCRHRIVRRLPRTQLGLGETGPSFRTSHSQSGRRVTAFLPALRKDLLLSLPQPTFRLRLFLRNLASSCLSSLIFDMFAAKRTLGNAKEQPDRFARLLLDADVADEAVRLHVRFRKWRSIHRYILK